MKENELLKLMRTRRSVLRFTTGDVSDEDVESILEAGRWAPSYINSQPWRFIVVRDGDLRERIAAVMRRITLAWEAFSQAPVMIIVAVDTRDDPMHFVEDAAAAAQNMALMAHSLGLASFWAGTHAGRSVHDSPEAQLRALLRVPLGLRIVAALPVGAPAYHAEGSRKPLSEMLHRDRYADDGRR